MGLWFGSWHSMGAAFGEQQLQQLKLTRQRDRLSAIAHMQFAINLVQVPLGSADSDHQSIGNLAIREASGDETKNL